MEDSERRQLGSGTRLLVTIALVMAIVLQLMLVHMVIRLHLDVAAQRNDLATKEDLRNLAVNLGPPDPAMSVLSGTCTDCHSRERFAGVHGFEGDIPDLVDRMSRLAGGVIEPEQVPRVEAALSMLKCAHCHTIDRLKEIAILSPGARWDLLMRMTKETGSTITAEDAQRIRDFYGQFWGWHTP